MQQPGEPTAPSAQDSAAPSAAPSALPGSKPSPRVLFSSVLGVAWMSLPALLSVGLFAYISSVTAWFNAQGPAGPWIGAGVFAVAAGLGLLPTYAQAILAGWIFGFSTGLNVAVAGCMVGAVLGFGVSRAVAGEDVQHVIDAKPRWRVARQALVEASTWRTVWLVTLLRFPPSSPFGFTNLVLAATGVQWVPMMIGTLIGMLPRTALAVWVAASAAAAAAESGVSDPVGLAKERWWAMLLGLLFLVGVLIIMQRLANQALRKAGLQPFGSSSADDSAPQRTPPAR